MQHNRVLFIFALFVLIIVGCAIPPEETNVTGYVFGTTVSITIFSSDKDGASAAIKDVFAEFEKIDLIFSSFNDKSQVYQLNKEGILYDADKELVNLIVVSKQYNKMSDGGFDITVKPILDLYKYTFSELNRSPTDKEIEDAKELIGSVLVNGSTISFAKDGMGIVLGGIAKGYAIDRAISVIKENGFENSLVDIGGDVRAVGSKNNKKWVIALRNPKDDNDFIEKFEIIDKAIATSGNYERYFDKNKKFHHIIDPRTGKSAKGLISATIIADNAVQADALATSVFVLGKEKGKELIESIDEVSGLLISEDREIIRIG